MPSMIRSYKVEQRFRNLERVSTCTVENYVKDLIQYLEANKDSIKVTDGQVIWCENGIRWDSSDESMWIVLSKESHQRSQGYYMPSKISDVKGASISSALAVIEDKIWNIWNFDYKWKNLKDGYKGKYDSDDRHFWCWDNEGYCAWKSAIIPIYQDDFKYQVNKFDRGEH